MAVYRTKDEWASIIDKYRNSGLTVAAWCRENGVNPKTLGAHLNKTGRRDSTRRGIGEWRMLVEEQKSSGMSRSEWCRKHGISPDTMYSAIKRLGLCTQASVKTKWIEVGNDSKIASKPTCLALNTNTLTAKPVSLDTLSANNQSSPESSPLDYMSSLAAKSNACAVKGEHCKIPGLGFDMMDSRVHHNQIHDKTYNIKIHYSDFEIEADAGYPVEKLADLIERLVK